MTTSTDCTRWEPLTILDLNDDCLYEILKYLPLMERLKFAYACDDFDDIIRTFLKSKTFSVSDCRGFFSPHEAEQVLDRFGPYIRRLNLDEPIDSQNANIYKSIAEYCYDIDAIELRIEFEANISSVYRILSTAKYIKSVEIERKIVMDDWVNPQYFRVLEEKLCEMIGNLTYLENLHLTHFCRASGKFLNKLTNLKHLNIEYCMNFKAEHFIAICLSVRLKSLNIDNCTFLNDESLEAMVATQTDLERLTLNTDFDARNFKIIGRLKRLKELVVYDYYGGRTLDGLLVEIVEHHGDEFRVLKLFVNAANAVETHRTFRQNLLCLKMLKVLCLPYECLTESYILEVGTQLLKLETLRFNIEDENRRRNENNRISQAEISRMARKPLDSDISEFVFRVELVRPIAEARRNANCKLLTIYLDIDNIADNLHEAREYVDNLDVIRIQPVF